MSAPQFTGEKGSLRKLAHASRPLHCFGLVVAELTCSHMEGEVALEVADSADGPWLCPRDGNRVAMTREPRTLAFRAESEAPFFARVIVTDFRSWARPVHYWLHSVKPPEPEAALPDPRAVIRTGAEPGEGVPA